MRVTHPLRHSRESGNPVRAARRAVVVVREPGFPLSRE
jgi:hypothetical protein